MENPDSMKILENELYKKACEIKLNAKIPNEAEIVDRILYMYEKLFQEHLTGLKDKPNPAIYIYILENMESGNEKLEDYFKPL